MGQHLGFAEASNTLRRTLVKAELTPEKCQFRLVAHGPVLPESASKGAKRVTEHRARRDIVAALEKRLADAMQEAGYEVLNDVHCRKPLDWRRWRKVRNEFAAEFPKLGGVE